MSRRSFATLLSMMLGLLVSLCVAPRVASAQYHGMQRPLDGTASKNELPKQLEDIGIEDKSGGDLPTDVKLVHSDGTPFEIASYLDGDRPLVVVLAYYKCPMLCSLVINELNTAMKGVGKTAGKDYRALVVSFDPRDTTDIAHEKRENYVHAYGRDVDVSGYEFATADPAQVKRLADALGFRYRWEEETKQFAHAAGIFVVTPKGKLSQALTGLDVKSDDLDKALDEAQKGVWHSPLKSALMYCFTYDPKSGSYVPVVINIMKVGGVLTLLGIAFLLFKMYRREKARAAADATSAEPASVPDRIELPLASIPPHEAPLAERGS